MFSISNQVIQSLLIISNNDKDLHTQTKILQNPISNLHLINFLIKIIIPPPII